MKRLGLWDNFLYMQKIYRKWWFWMGIVIVLVPAALYLPWYIPWKVEQWGIERLRGEEQAIWEEYEAENEALADAYRNDVYGGSTPEKTLDLFIEALEAKNYELASKYFIVEKREEALEENTLGEGGGANQYIIDAYRKGKRGSISHVDASKFTIEMYPQGERVPFSVRFLLNPFTQKWKIVEL